jgi:hypothetical protein
VVLAGLALLGSLTSCLREPAAPPAPASASEVEVEQPLACGFPCGDNGGVIDGVFFWELNLGREVGANEVAYQRFARNEGELAARRTLRLDVLGARLRALDPITNTWIEGANLTNGVMEISVAGDLYLVKIVAVHGGSQGEPYWTKPGREFVETYTLRWAVKPPMNITPVYADVCATTTPPHEPWTNQLDALVFEGERYVPSSKQISPWPTTPFLSWFNVACAGSLPAKMHLVRRTTAASKGVFTSTIDDDRQAFARMWAADYCGTGETFTVTGQKLRVRDRKPFQAQQDGWIAEQGPVGWSDTDDAEAPGFSYEAVWGPDGAVCLDTPRRIERATIEDACGHRIDRCSDQSWFPGDWKSHGMLLSANPAP